MQGCVSAGGQWRVTKISTGLVVFSKKCWLYECRWFTILFKWDWAVPNRVLATMWRSICTVNPVAIGEAASLTFSLVLLLWFSDCYCHNTLYWKSVLLLQVVFSFLTPNGKTMKAEHGFDSVQLGSFLTLPWSHFHIGKLQLPPGGVWGRDICDSSSTESWLLKYCPRTLTWVQNFLQVESSRELRGV